MCTAVHSAAMTLGRLQGQATLGRPLDVLIQVMWDSGDEGNECLAADVSYGDAPLGAGQVSVRIEGGAPTAPRASSVRVFSSVAVNEPIVSLSLRSGCRQKSVRQYILFTELPSASAPSSTQSSSPNAVSAVAPAPLVPASKTVAAPAPTASALPWTEPVAQAPSQPSSRPAAKGRRAAVAGAGPSVTLSQATQQSAPKAAASRKTDTRARLRLDPLELILERDPVLRISSELLSPPQEGMTPQRAQAAAWWRTLNASPEDALRDASRLQSVQGDIQALQTVATNNQKSLADLAEKLQLAKSEKYANGFVYSLMGLCLLCLIGLLLLWRRLSQLQAPPWSHGFDAVDSQMVYADLDPEPEVPLAPGPKPHTSAASTVAAAAATSAVDLDLNLSEPPQAVLAGQHEFSAGVFANSRSIDSEELLDIRQQADFFLALEQHDKAIELLSTRIAQCDEARPLICLDLLKIYHNLGRRKDFDILRAEFNHWFTGRVPDFSSFSDEGRPLSSYPTVMNRITELWPAPSVLDYIESCTYQHSNTQPGTNFDLQAYRELLLLHSVAKRLVRLAYGNQDEHPSEFMYIPTSVASLAADEPQKAGDSAAAQREGAHLHDTSKPGIRQSGVDAAPDPQPSNSRLGAMRVPVHGVPPLDLEL